jgi:hypothetical protein
VFAVVVAVDDDDNDDDNDNNDDNNNNDDDDDKQCRLISTTNTHPIGTILFSFNFIGMVIGLCMIANAVFNAYIIFKYPEYENIQRNDAQSDIKEFLVSHPAFAKQFVDAGVDIITSNPGTLT